jgi:hypothetical protein
VESVKAFQKMKYNKERCRIISMIFCTTALYSLIFSGTGCSTSLNKQPMATPSPKPLSAEERIVSAETPSDIYGLEFIDDEKVRIEGRKAAREYVRKTYPSAKINGMATILIERKLCLVRVDMIVDKKRAVLPLITQQFWRDDATPYFRADLMQGEMSSLIQLKLQEAVRERVSKEAFEAGMESKE